MATYPKKGGIEWVRMPEENFSEKSPEPMSDISFAEKVMSNDEIRYGWKVPAGLHAEYRKKWIELYGERGMTKLLRKLTTFFDDL